MKTYKIRSFRYPVVVTVNGKEKSNTMSAISASAWLWEAYRAHQDRIGKGIDYTVWCIRNKIVVKMAGIELPAYKIM